MPMTGDEGFSKKTTQNPCNASQVFADSAADVFESARHHHVEESETNLICRLLSAGSGF